jgi:subtilase family serine protease
VKNTGNRPTAVPSWSDQLRLSIDTSISTTWSLGNQVNPTYLGPGESYSQTKSVTIPNDLNGDYYIVLDADFGSRVDECNESNNRLRAASPIQISIAPAPDLRVFSATAPANVFSGDTMSVQFTILNAGEGAAFGTWREYFYLSADTVFDGIQDKYAGAVTHTGTLLPESSYTGTVRIAIPRDVFGSYVILVKTDAENRVYESIWEGNNISVSNLFTITLSPPPDMVPVALLIPPVGNSGKKVTITWNVQNQGPGPVVNGAWYDRIYVQSSATFDSATARLAGTFRIYGSLPPDSGYSRTDSITIPDGYTGDYYVYLQTDYRNDVFEHTFENNNVLRSSSSMTVDLSPWTDLQVSEVTAPPAATAGDDITITFSVHNHGVAPSPVRFWKDRIYYSPSATWTPSTAKYLKDVGHHEVLQPDSSYSVSSLVTLPDDISGTQYIYVYADAGNEVYEHTDEGNNAGMSAGMLVAAYPNADLTVDTVGAPVSAAAGQPVSLYYLVKNAGAGRPLTSSWDDVVYLSVDTVLTAGTDILLERIERREPLEPGQYYARTLSPVLPDVPAGNYYILVKSDERETVNDANILNNTGHPTERMFVNVLPPPDLLPASVQFATPATGGQPLDIICTVSNAGAGATFQASWFDGFYLSTDQAFDSLDIRLGTFNRKGILAASGAYAESLTVEIPNYLEGDYYLIARTDILNDVGEGDLEINNALPLAIQVVQPPPGDLVVSSVDIPTNAVPGEDVTISWVTRNQGPNPVQGRMNDAVYVSADQTWDIGDPLLGIVSRTIDIAPGASVQSSFKMNLSQMKLADSVGNITDVLPGVSVGAYNVIVRTDIRNNIRETVENNNSGASAGQMNVGIPQLVLGTPATGSLVNHQKKYYRVDVGSGLDLRIRLTGDLTSAANELYVAFGRTPTASDFDFNASESFRANRELMIPSTQNGSYYVLVLVRNMIGQTSQNFTIAADALPFSLVGVTPPEGGKGGRVTCVLNGAGFRDTTAFYLDNGSVRIDGEVMKRVNSTQVHVRFDLRLADYGSFNVVAANGGITSTLLNSFSVVIPVVNQLQHAVYTPYGSRGLLIGRPATYDITVENGDNNDHDLVLLTLLVPTDQDFTLETDDFFTRPVPASLPDSIALPNAGVRVSQDWAAMTVIAKGVRAGQTLHARLSMKKVVSPCGVCGEQLPVIVDVRGVTFGEFLTFELDFMDQLRTEILKLDPSTVPSQVLTLLNNPAWQADLEQGYRDLGLLDDRPVTGRMLPMVYNPFDTLTMKYDPALIKFLADGGRSLCSKLVNLGYSLFTVYGLANAFMALSIGAEASFFAGLLVVSGPVGWAVLAASAAVFAYGMYQLSQGGDLLPAKLICRKLLGSFDPNDIIGPTGYGDRKWIGITQTQPYTIRFENDPKLATAPAQVVTVTQPLDSTSDPRSFRLGRFGFRNMTFDVPSNRSFYSGRLDVRDSLGIYVDVNAGLDITKNEAFWIFTSVDPATQQVPTDPLSGLLPINDTSGNGEGFVSYTIRASATSHTGDSLRAKATIVFDINPSINTPMIANTIDAGLPASSVSLLPSTTNSTSFTVKWKGSDDSTGSGLRSYSVFVSVNDSLFLPWMLDVTDTMATYTGIFGNKYAFYSLATDNAGNIEHAKGSAEATTIVTGVRDLSKELPKEFALYQNYPNPFNPATTIQYDIPRDARVTLKIYSILGQEVAVLVDGVETAGAKSVTFDARSYATGVYFYRLTAESAGNSFTRIKKMLLMK